MCPSAASMGSHRYCDFLQSSIPEYLIAPFALCTASALLVGLLFVSSRQLSASADARQALLDAIKAKGGDDEVISALRELAKQNPTKSPAKSETIFGEWNLLWASQNAEARPQLASRPQAKYSACIQWNEWPVLLDTAAKRDSALILQGQLAHIMGRLSHVDSNRHSSGVDMTAGEPSLEAPHTRKEHSAPRKGLCGRRREGRQSH